MQQSFMKTIRSQQGLTLTEILIVIALLGGIMTLVVSQVMESFNEGRSEQARIQMQSIGQELMNFRRHCNTLPTTDAGLQALLKKPSGLDCEKYRPNGYIKDLPKDPWDTPYIYERTGPTSYTITSLGADKQQGGEGYNADIVVEN